MPRPRKTGENSGKPKCPRLSASQEESFKARIAKAELTATKVKPGKPQGYYRTNKNGEPVGNPMLKLTMELWGDTPDGLRYEEAVGYQRPWYLVLDSPTAQPCGHCRKFAKASEKCDACTIFYAHEFVIEQADAFAAEIAGMTRTELQTRFAELQGLNVVIDAHISEFTWEFKGKRGVGTRLEIDAVHPDGWRYEGDQSEGQATSGEAEQAPPPNDDDIPF